MFWITSILGVALGVSPFVLGFADHIVAVWTYIVLGAIVLIVSYIGGASGAMDKRWAYWVMGLAGVAAFVAPFLFGYADHTQPLHAPPLWAGLFLGALLALLDGVKVFQALPRTEAH